MTEIFTQSRAAHLRTLIESQNTEFILEAHNGISAKIVEEAGFKGIWASGLSISASCGVRDNNELSWTQVVSVVEQMAECTNIPILLDGDTGYGNFNNFRRLIRKLEQCQVAGVCIEDKLFPKTNSFLRGSVQPLADVDEFCGKIKAGKDALQDDDFVIVARVEALIAGHSMQEALSRAQAYRQAGADAILIHSKQSHAREIFEFLEAWDNRHPVIVVPTKYYSTPTQEFINRKTSLVIWANHLLRASVTNMQKVASTIYQENAISCIEDEIVPVKEIFRLQGDEELQAAESKYLQREQALEHHAIILAATQGADLGQATLDKPKTLIKIGNTTILDKMFEHLNAIGIEKIKVVSGFKSELLDKKYPTIRNKDYQTTGQLASLQLGMDDSRGQRIILFGDILFKKYIAQRLLDHSGDIVIVVDASTQKPREDKASDYIQASHPDSAHLEDKIVLKSMSFSKPPENHHGEWIGMLKLSDKGQGIIKQYLHQKVKDSSFKTLNIPDMLNDLVAQHQPIDVMYIHGHWLDVDDVLDLNLAHSF